MADQTIGDVSRGVQPAPSEESDPRVVPNEMTHGDGAGNGPAPEHCANTDGASAVVVLNEVAYCASCWDGKARLLGNVRAEDIVRACSVVPDLLAALKDITSHMDRAGGDGYGMPECPWCRFQTDDNGHSGDCELEKARAVIAKAEAR
jgi:hypothetical protein